MLGNRKRKQPAAATVEATRAAPVSVNDDLDPAWVAEQAAAETAAERQKELGIGDDEFATAIWFVQADEAFHNPIGGSASRRVARLVTLGEASGLTGGQLDALTRLMARIDAARDVLGAAECRRASGRLQVVSGAGGRNF